MKPTQTVKVDFSRGLRGGLVRVSQRRAPEPLHVGDVVNAVDPAEEMEFTGTVERLTEDGRFAYLLMDWEDATSGNLPAPGVSIEFYPEFPRMAAVYNAYADRLDAFMPFVDVELGRAYSLIGAAFAFDAYESAESRLFGSSDDDSADKSGDLLTLAL
jgi:hypothetical protein